MYAVLYKPAVGETPKELISVVNATIDPDNWDEKEDLEYTNCADRSTLETELATFSAEWDTLIDVKYYMKNEG